MAGEVKSNAGYLGYKGPVSTPSSSSLDLGALAASLGLQYDPNAQVLSNTSQKAPKSGTYTRTYDSSSVPDDLAITDKINKIFQQYYGRDANQSEIATWLPQLKAKYTDPSGKTKTTINETYVNGNLVSTEYLTADKSDPSLWLEGQIKNQLVTGKNAVDTLGIPAGPAGKYFIAVKDLAFNNGIRLSDQTAQDYANKIVSGVMDQNDVYNTIRESAASAFPQLSDKIKAGIDLRTLADPYIQSMSNILEIPSTAIDLFDPKIRSAMAYTLPDGSVGTKSLYDFENELRKDDRWQYTNQARKEVADTTLRVLRDFGLQA